MAQRYSDQEIIDMIESTSERSHSTAITFLRKTYESLILRYVVYNSGSREDGEELLDDVLLIFFRNVREKRFQQRGVKISAYIYAIARYRWLKELKKRKIRPKISPEPEGFQWEGEADDSQMQEYETKDFMQKLLDRLEPTCQKLINAFLAGMTMDEIAKHVGLKNADSAKAQKYHCLKKMQKLGKQLL